MRDFYNYDIVYDRFENVYKLQNEDQAYELPGLVFTQKELLALLTESLWRFVHAQRWRRQTKS